MVGNVEVSVVGSFLVEEFDVGSVVKVVSFVGLAVTVELVGILVEVVTLRGTVTCVDTKLVKFDTAIVFVLLVFVLLENLETTDG